MDKLACSASRGCPMPLSIPAGMTRTHVLQAIADLDAGLDHPFGQPTGYELLHEGKRYPPKAVVGLACRHSLGRVLLPEEFSGSEAPGKANFVLRKLGFTVGRKGESETVQDTDAARDWTEQEVRLIVADYFAMLVAELQGEPYKKSEHRKALIPSWRGAPMAPSSSSTRTSAACWSSWVCPMSRVTSQGETIRVCSPRRLRASWTSALV